MKIHEMRRLERQPKPAAGDEVNRFLAERNGVYPPTLSQAMNETVNTFLAERNDVDPKPLKLFSKQPVGESIPFGRGAERVKIHEKRRLERQPKPAAGDEVNRFLAERNGVYPPARQSASQ